MEDRYLQALKSIERRAQDDKQLFPDILSDRLLEITVSMYNEPMSDNDYIKLCELFYRHYHKQNNTKAMMFCLFRIQEFVYLKSHRRNQKKYKRIHFSSTTDEMTTLFMKKKRNYYRRQLHDYLKKLAISSTCITVFFMILLILVAHMKFLVGWIISMVIGAIIYFSGQLYVYDRVYDQQMKELRKHADRSHQIVDKSIKGA